MPIQLLSIGPPTIIQQNVVYACPVKACTVTTTAALEKSVTGSGGWTALASGGSVTGGFVRCTTTSPTVTLTVATAGSGGGSVSGDIAVTSVALGTTPALTGAVRLSNGQYIKSRNSGNSADVNLLAQNGSTIEIGQAGVDVNLPGATTYFSGGALALSGTIPQISFFKRASGSPTGAANWGYMWMRDNGSGKMQLMIQFPTGAAVQIAIEP